MSRHYRDKNGVRKTRKEELVETIEEEVGEITDRLFNVLLTIPREELEELATAIRIAKDDQHNDCYLD